MKYGFYHSLKVSGFTLIELVVSLGIILLMMSVIFADYPSAVTRATLVNASYSTSLLIRESQLKGSAISSGNFSLTDNSPYGGSGVYVSLSSPGRLILFNDTVDSNVAMPYGLLIGNGLYENNGSVNETSSITNFPTGYTISKLCIGTGYPFYCNNEIDPSITALTISFSRPRPEPNFYINNSILSSYGASCIELVSPKLQKRSVQIFNSGMIRTLSGGCQ